MVAIANNDEPIANNQHCRREGRHAATLEKRRDPVADLAGGQRLVAARGQMLLDGLVDAGGRIVLTRRAKATAPPT